MSERPVSEEEIDERLNKIINDEEMSIRIKHTLRFLSILIYNLRFDLVLLTNEVEELKRHLLNCLKEEEKEEEVPENAECEGYYL